MIMRNDKKENENNDPERMFTKILKAAKPYLDIFDEDPENHTARGLLETHDAAYPAVLAYDPDKKTFAIAILFHVDNDWTMPRVMILLRLQNHTAVDSSSIKLDTESSMVRVESHAQLPAFNVVQAVVTAAIRDATHVLENDDFRKFVN